MMLEEKIKAIRNSTLLIIVLINLFAFGISSYLEIYFFERNYIFTVILFSILFSVIKLIYLHKCDGILLFHSILIHYLTVFLFVISALIISGIGIPFLDYVVIFFVFALCNYANFYKVDFIRLNLKFLLSNLIWFLLFLISYELLGIYRHDFGVPFTYFFWLLFMTMYMHLLQTKNSKQDSFSATK